MEQTSITCRKKIWQSSFVVRLGDTLHLVSATRRLIGRRNIPVVLRTWTAQDWSKASSDGRFLQPPNLRCHITSHNVDLCSWRPLTLEPPPAPLDNLLLRDWYDGDVDLIEAHALQQIFGIRIDFQRAIVGILGEVEGGDFGNILVFALTLFFL